MPDALRRPRWRIAAGLFAMAALLAVYAHVAHAWPLGFVALMPWLLALDGLRTAKGAVVVGALAAFAFVIAVLLWFGAAIGAYVGIGAVPGTLTLVALSPVLQPQWIAYALARQLAGRRHGPVVRAVAAASAWVACEALLPKLLGDTLGHGLYPSATLRQMADLGGAAGITVALLLVNEAVARAIAIRTATASPHRRARAWLRPLLAGTAIVACMAGYGVARLSALRAPAPDAPALRIAMVQASIIDYERLRREMGAYAVVRRVLDTHYALSWSAIRDHHADVLLWSETMYPTTFGHPRSADGAALDREIQGFVDAAGVPLVFGTYDLDAAGEYNAAVFLEPGRGVLGTYRKTYPFPLTESVPRWLDGPLLRRALPWVGGWRAGDGARVLPLRGAGGREVAVVPLICLDDVHPDLAIDGARLGAQAIVGLSNDSWFTHHPAGARLHLAVAAFRSIETRLPQVRVTTNGLSAIVDDTGAISAVTAIGDQAVLTAEVQARNPPPTLMVRWGDWVGRAGALFLLALAASSGWRALRRRGAHAGDEPAAPETAVLDIAVLPPALRAASAALRVCAGAGLLWLALDMWLRVGLRVASLSQLWWFAGAVVAPAVAAWAIVRACQARARIENGALVLEQRRRRIEIPLASIAALQPWRVPLPGAGVDLRLASGRRWTHGLAVARPRSLQRLLSAAGAPARIDHRIDTVLADRMEARGRAASARLHHPVIKFLLFPLLPALIAFRLHQVIAYGGTFGEWLTYGPAAWMTGLLIWWGSWALGLMLFAAALRAGIEIVVLSGSALWPARAAATRDALEWVGRAVFYLGVPAWLAWRLAPAVL